MKVNKLTMVVSDEMAGLRFDQALARLFPEYSRSQLKTWLDAGLVHINGGRLRPKDKVSGGETVEVQVPDAPAVRWEPEPLPLNIVFEDEHILVLNKPMRQVVHPGAGNAQGTLVNAVLHYLPGSEQLPRGGVVHRLDKDTTGVMVVAKTMVAYQGLVAALQAREVKRIYEAVVCGVPVAGGTIDAPMGRHPKDRKKMAVLDSNYGKTAITHYRVQQKFRQHALLEVRLETGRTHQIRVHLAHIHYPIVGDKAYAGRLRLPAKASEALQEKLRTFPRQALHAKQLGLVHPVSHEFLEWQVPRPLDMEDLISTLQEDQKTYGDPS